MVTTILSLRYHSLKKTIINWTFVIFIIISILGFTAHVLVYRFIYWKLFAEETIRTNIAFKTFGSIYLCLYSLTPSLFCAFSLFYLEKKGEKLFFLPSLIFCLLYLIYSLVVLLSYELLNPVLDIIYTISIPLLVFGLTFVLIHFFLSNIAKPQKQFKKWVYLILFSLTFVAGFIFMFLLYLPGYFSFTSALNYFMFVYINIVIMEEYCIFFLFIILFIPILFTFLFRSLQLSPFFASGASLISYIVAELFLNHLQAISIQVIAKWVFIFLVSCLLSWCVFALKKNSYIQPIK